MAFLNSCQAPMQYAVDTPGFGFDQGKTLFFRRRTLEHEGVAMLSQLSVTAVMVAVDGSVPFIRSTCLLVNG